MRITRITLNSFLVSLLGILTAEVGFSDGRQNGSYDVCYKGGEICYILVSNEESNWNTAHNKCQYKNLSLPIIRNQEEQTEFETQLKQLKSKYPSISAVWTSGKRKTYKNWTWINGQRLSNAFTILNGHSAMETHMVIKWENTGTQNILKPVNPVYPTWYLCQYKNRQCKGQQHEVNATNGCLIPDEYGNTSWYEARNECLLKNGDLAILTDQDLQNPVNHRFQNKQYQHWIGLRRVDWVWITTNISKVSLEEEMNYTKWSRQSMPTDGNLCLNIQANNGEWIASNCSNSTLSVICEKRGLPTTGSTSRKSTTATTAGNSPTATVTIAATINDHNGDSSMTVYAAIVAGVVIVILVIVVILVVILCRKSKSSNNKTERPVIDSETKDRKTKENPSTTTTATEGRSIYADIALTEKTARDDDTVEANQKPTVYASLDFDQGGVTYAEPSKLYSNTQKNISAPIYAEPLNGGTGNQKGTTSAGSTPAVKIGPMGDVYALPTTNVTPSSSEKTTERAIYANT